MARSIRTHLTPAPEAVNSREAEKSLREALEVSRTLCVVWVDDRAACENVAQTLAGMLLIWTK